MAKTEKKTSQRVVDLTNAGDGITLQTGKSYELVVTEARDSGNNDGQQQGSDAQGARASQALTGGTDGGPQQTMIQAGNIAIELALDDGSVPTSPLARGHTLRIVATVKDAPADATYNWYAHGHVSIAVRGDLQVEVTGVTLSSAEWDSCVELRVAAKGRTGTVKQLLTVFDIEIREVLGLYKPGQVDPIDAKYGTGKAAGYELGYKSADDKGRIFANHEPLAQPRTASSAKKALKEWDAAWKADTQYIELKAGTVPALSKDPLPASYKVAWTWEDPDDRSDQLSNIYAAMFIDANDFDAGKRAGFKGNDNVGVLDFHGAQAPFEEVAPYTLGDLDDHTVTSELQADASAVRLHCTNVAGDDFKVRCEVVSGEQRSTGDATGIMTVWKRVSVEYVAMQSAFNADFPELPLADVSRAFEPARVQLDFLEPTEVADEEFLAQSAGDEEDDCGAWADAHFSRKDKPGYFFLAAALSPNPESWDAWKAAKQSTLAETVFYEGEATIEDAEIEGTPIQRLRIPVLLPEVEDDAKPEEIPTYVYLREGLHEARLAISYQDLDASDTLLTCYWDYVPSFPLDSIDGNVGAVYEDKRYYFPSKEYARQDQSFRGPGLGFSQTVQVRVASGTPGMTAGISPPVAVDGEACFAGRTIVFNTRPQFELAQASAAVAAADPSEKALRQAELEELRKTVASKSAWFVTHELAHAFGFPHKCGATAWDPGASSRCALNYPRTWLYKLGDDGLNRFYEGVRSTNLCAQHLVGIRRVHLEDNKGLGWT